MKRWIVLAALAACEQQPSKLDDIAAPRVQPPAGPPLVFDTAAIDGWVAAQVAKRGIVGASLVIVKDGKTVLARGYGKKHVAQADLVDADTPFALGSVSKQFACAAAYLLADRGQLAMTDPVSKFYPQLSNGQATLADLGGHTAGYRDFYPLDYVDTRMFDPIEADDLIADYAPKIDFAPRARYSYSNTGYTMLAQIIAKVGGMPYGQALEQWIFKPLGMTASIVRPANAATGHVAFLVEPPAAGPFEADGWLLGAGDVWASANDLAKWDLAFAEGKLLSDDARRAMSSPRTLADGRTTQYSCGFGIRIVNGETTLRHGGWVGGFFTFNTIIPRTKSAVVWLTNGQHADIVDIHDRIVQLVTTDAAAIPAIPGPPPAEAARTLIAQIQRGAIDRATIGDDLAAYYDDPRFAAAAARLRALGEPTVRVTSRAERGAMEVTSLSIEFSTKTFDASMYRSTDGKIRQLLFMR